MNNVLRVRAGAVPVLYGGCLVRGGHVQVRHDEAVGVDLPGAGQLADRRGPAGPGAGCGGAATADQPRPAPGPALPGGSAARASCPAKYPASARMAIHPDRRARSGSQARARCSRSGAVAPGSVPVPAPQAPATASGPSPPPRLAQPSATAAGVIRRGRPPPSWTPALAHAAGQDPARKSSPAICAVGPAACAIRRGG